MYVCLFASYQNRDPDLRLPVSSYTLIHIALLIIEPPYQRHPAKSLNGHQLFFRLSPADHLDYPMHLAT
jgi:hypothetical protein